MINIGVLSFQGSVEEHCRSLSNIDGVTCIEVKTIESLKKVSGLIIPGGESTTLGKLLVSSGLLDAIKDLVSKGFPVWGTCAGMILMAKKIVGQPNVHLGVMDIVVRRNAYGSQIDSFNCNVKIPRVSNNDISAVFIRAPWIESVGDDVDILCEFDGRIVAAQQNNMLVTSFHPELTDDLSFHKYFIGIVNATKTA